MAAAYVVQVALVVGGAEHAAERGQCASDVARNLTRDHREPSQEPGNRRKDARQLLRTCGPDKIERAACRVHPVVNLENAVLMSIALRQVRSWGVIAALLQFMYAATARAQVADAVADSAGRSDRQSVWTVWSANAHGQPLATRHGYRYDRGLMMVGLQRRWFLSANRSGSLELDYTIDLLPVVLSTDMPEYVIRDVPCGAGTQRGCLTQVSILTGEHTAHGAGASPVGFLGRWRVSPDVGLQLRASGGMIYFSQAIPDPLGCQLNFTADAGVAVDIRVTSKLALVAGWRLNHISNGGRGKVNPGMNSRMIELGLSLAR